MVSFVNGPTTLGGFPRPIGKMTPLIFESVKHNPNTVVVIGKTKSGAFRAEFLSPTAPLDQRQTNREKVTYFNPATGDSAVDQCGENPN